MNFPGLPGAGASASGTPPSAPGQFNPQDPEVQKYAAMMSGAMESCYTKTVMSGVMGFGLGGLFGMFMASMAYDTPFHTAGAGTNATPISSLPLRRQLQVGFREMGARSWSTAKNFGMVGALFSGIECGIEGLRAKNDLGNGVAAGCLTGAILARNAGPQAAAFGCAGFAAFSAAIDAWMRMPKDED
ncbi:Tim17-domain-containing protein [Thozetella sp. PMI_491]|nr:Tim17-domain-containing protein [Thozetella sp. PMI_491]